MHVSFIVRHCVVCVGRVLRLRYVWLCVRVFMAVWSREVGGCRKCKFCGEGTVVLLYLGLFFEPGVLSPLPSVLVALLEDWGRPVVLPWVGPSLV